MQFGRGRGKDGSTQPTGTRSSAETPAGLLSCGSREGETAGHGGGLRASMKFDKRYFTFVAACLLALASGMAGAQPGPKSIKPSAGPALCSALTPADFTKVGVPVSAAYPYHPGAYDDPSGAYCTYESKAGKVEFDIFFPAGANSQEVSNTERAAVGDSGGKYEPVRLDGADYAQISLTSDAQIVVRKGKAVFGIFFPKSANSRQQLLALAQIVLVRLKQ